MNIKPPDYKFCPFCARTLVTAIQENRERKYCLKCGWKHFPSPGIAVAGVVTRNGKILMVQRNREPFRGTWMFPAGFVEYGEDLHEALSREIKEETGLEISSQADLMCIRQSIDDLRSPGHFVAFFRVNALGKIKNNDSDENQAVKWFSIMSPPQIGFPTHKLVMGQLQRDIVEARDIEA